MSPYLVLLLIFKKILGRLAMLPYVLLVLLLSIYVWYSNVSYIYPVSNLVEIKLFQIVSNVTELLAKLLNCFKCHHITGQTVKLFQMSPYY